MARSPSFLAAEFLLPDQAPRLAGIYIGRVDVLAADGNVSIAALQEALTR